MTSASSIFASLCLLAVGLCACNSVPEYRYLDDGTAWKLLAFGDGQTSVDTVGWIKLDATVIHPERNDTLAHFVGKPFAESNDPVWQLLASRSVGDSLHLRFGSSNFLVPKVNRGDTLIAHLSVKAYKSVAQLRDARQQEYMLLDTLIRSDSIQSGYTEYRGIWYKRLLPPADTLQVRKGTELVIHYQGSHLDGRVFDDSRRMQGPFRFVYGNEGQVIKGLELALEQMQRGEHAQVILPSWFAFGKKGSADGRVQPYTTVVYRVELMDVAKY